MDLGVNEGPTVGRHEGSKLSTEWDEVLYDGEVQGHGSDLPSPRIRRAGIGCGRLGFFGEWFEDGKIFDLSELAESDGIVKKTATSWLRGLLKSDFHLMTRGASSVGAHSV